MASIEQRGNSYRIIFRYNGQRFTRSLHTKCERIATAALHRLEDNLRRVQLGTLVIPDTLDPPVFLLSDGQVASIAKVEANPAARWTIAKLCDHYMASLPEGAIEATTRVCLEIHIRHFKRIFGTRLATADLDSTALQDYVNQRSRAVGRRGRPLSARTIQKEIATLNCIWAWALQRKHVNHVMPKSGLRLPKTDEKQPFQTMADALQKIGSGCLSDEEAADIWDSVFLTIAEVRELLEHVRSHAIHPFIYPMIAFAAHTGARRSEIIGSHVHDIDLANRRVFIREKKRKRGQRTTRCVPLSPFLEIALKEWFKKHPGGATTFPIESIAGTSKIRVRPTQLTVEEATHHFNQTMKGTKWENLSGWHVFRHSFCSNCAAAGVDQRLIDEWVGHQTDEMRKRYRHLIPNQQAAAISSVFRE